MPRMMRILALPRRGKSMGAGREARLCIALPNRPNPTHLAQKLLLVQEPVAVVVTGVEVGPLLLEQLLVRKRLVNFLAAESRRVSPLLCLPFHPPQNSSVIGPALIHYLRHIVGLVPIMLWLYPCRLVFTIPGYPSPLHSSIHPSVRPIGSSTRHQYDETEADKQARSSHCSTTTLVPAPPPSAASGRGYHGQNRL